MPPICPTDMDIPQVVILLLKLASPQLSSMCQGVHDYFYKYVWQNTMTLKGSMGILSNCFLCKGIILVKAIRKHRDRGAIFLSVGYPVKSLQNTVVKEKWKSCTSNENLRFGKAGNVIKPWSAMTKNKGWAKLRFFLLTWLEEITEKPKLSTEKK